MFKFVPWGVTMKNTTEVIMFVLKDLTDNPEIQFILFFLFLAIYPFIWLEI